VELQQEHLYQFYCDRNATDILITLTALGGGDPDLYVSRNKVPNMRNSTWNSTTWEGEALLIKADDPYFKGKSTAGTYNVLVVGKTASLYSIVINLDQRHVVQLLQGQPQQGHLERNSENFYYYYNAYDKDLTVYLTLHYGDAFLRANPQDPIYDDFYSRLPKRWDGVWSSVQAGERNRLVVPRTDPKFCFNCNVLIGVFSNSTNTTYTIEASNDLLQAMLQEGLSLRDDVAKKAWSYYLYSSVDSNAEIVISLTSYTGDADMFVSRHPVASEKNFKWKAMSADMVEDIVIKPTDRDAGVGEYYIGVYGVKDSSYAITAFNRMNFVTLTSGLPQHHLLHLNSSDFLRFQLQGDDVAECSLQSTNPLLNPRVFINFHPKGKDVHPPDESRSEISFLDKMKYDNDFRQLSFKLKWTKPGKYDIAVYGSSHLGQEQQSAPFSIVCTTRHDFTTLTLGAREFSRLGTENSKRYEVVVEEPGTLEVYVEHCIGRVEVFVSQNYTMQADPQLMVFTYELSDGLDLVSLAAKSGSVFLTVVGLQGPLPLNSTSFQMHARMRSDDSEEPKVLMPGNEGKLSVRRVSSNEYKVSWAHPSGVSVNSLMYQVYSFSDDLAMNSVCSIDAWRLSGVPLKPVEVVGEESAVIHMRAPFYATVVAASRDYDLPIIASVLYNTVKVEDSDEDDSEERSSATWWFLGALVLLGSFAVVYAVLRVRKRQQDRPPPQRGYEMGSLLQEFPRSA
jgi:hypothetical protein